MNHANPTKPSTPRSDFESPTSEFSLGSAYSNPYGEFTPSQAALLSDLAHFLGDSPDRVIENKPAQHLPELSLGSTHPSASSLLSETTVVFTNPTSAAEEILTAVSLRTENRIREDYHASVDFQPVAPIFDTHRLATTPVSVSALSGSASPASDS